MNRNARKYPKVGDPRCAPAYTIAEVSRYVGIPCATVRSWVVGRAYPVKSGRHYFQPVTIPPDKKFRQLSFLNLVEIYVLGAIRREHRIPLPGVRKAIGYLREQFGSRHPLAEQKIETDGRDLFIRWLNSLINISREGQLAMPEFLDAHLKRIEWDTSGLASRLYLLTRRQDLYSPKVVVIDPRISFGRPVLKGTGIATAVIADRYKGGETIRELAHDYDRDPLDIEEAIRCELVLDAA